MLGTPNHQEFRMAGDQEVGYQPPGGRKIGGWEPAQWLVTDGKKASIRVLIGDSPPTEGIIDK